MSEFELTEVEKLIQLLKEGREELFKLIDPQIQRIVDRTCAEMKISNYYEEVLGAVYERVIKGFEGFQGRSSYELKGWIRRIAENAARDFINRTLKKTPAAAAQEEPEGAGDVTQPGEQERLYGHLNLIQFLKTLEPVEGYILVLYSLLEYTFDEIAQVVKLPNYTVRRRYLDIIKRVKKFEDKK